VSEEFAPPPTPSGTPAGTVNRSDFRPLPPARRRGRFPRWLAALLVAGGVVIVGGVVTQLLLTSRAANLEQAEPDATGRLHSAQLVSGMCIDDLPAGVGVVTVVPCGEPHAAKVATAITLQGAEFPGDELVANTVLDFCTSQLAPGAPLAEVADGRKWLAWVPSAQTWKAGDRAGLCIVTSSTDWIE